MNTKWLMVAGGLIAFGLVLQVVALVLQAHGL